MHEIGIHYENSPIVISYHILYHSYQDCPTDFHILHSEPSHGHVLVPQLSHGCRAFMRTFT